MPASFIAKTPTSIPLPDGSYCALFNDFTNGYISNYYVDEERVGKLFTKLDMSTLKKQRCLHYQIYHSKFSSSPDSVLAVPYIKDSKLKTDDEIKSIVSEPLFECISPTSTYVDEHGTANVLFWTNLIPGESLEVDNKTGQYIYDSSKILKINHDEINDFSFTTGEITRLLCSVKIIFRQLYLSTEIADGLEKAPMSLVPIAKDVVIIKQVKADSPVLDFSTGGSGSAKTSNSRHAHTSNSDCGFAFAVFHPGTGVPLGNPWKN